MKLRGHKGGLFVALLLHLCQAQDLAPPSPHPESAPPSLVEVIDAVKAAFEQAVKISKDNAAREAFEQVVEELVPKQGVPEQAPATADGTEDFNRDAVSAVVHEHGDGGKENLPALDDLQEHAEMALDPSESELVQSNEEVSKEDEKVGLDHKPLENPVEGSQTPHQESPQEGENLKAVEETKIEPVESIKEPPRHGEEPVHEPEELPVAPVEESEGKRLVDPKDIGSNLFSVQVELSPDSETEGESQEGKEAGEQGKDNEEKQEQKLVELLEEQNSLDSGRTGEADVEEVEKVKDINDRESKVQKLRFPDGKPPKLPESIKQMAESQEQGVIKDVTTQGGALMQDSQEEGEHGRAGAVGVGGEAIEDVVESVEGQVDAETRRSGEEDDALEPMEEMEVLVKATQKLLQKTSRQKTPHEPAEVTLDMERAAVVKDVKGAAEPQERVVAESNDVTQETNDMNGIVTSRDPLLGPVEPNQETLIPGNSAKALPPFPTQSPEHAGTVELVEEHTDHTRPSSPEVWKIGAIAAVFFLILQTIITVIYILKCKTKTNRNAVDDLPKYSKVQQESIAMKTIPTDSTVV